MNGGHGRPPYCFAADRVFDNLRAPPHSSRMFVVNARALGTNRPAWKWLLAAAAMFLIAGVSSRTARAEQGQTEAARVIRRLLAPPRIKAAPGFSARLVVPPGELYDPLQIVPHGDQVLVNDDGGEEDGGGGRIAAIDRQGEVSILLGPDKLLPDVGMDVAPSNFGNFGGQIFILTQPLAGDKGLWVAHQISHINLAKGGTKILCKLPPAGQAGHGVAGAGSAARFGPPGSRFARKLFAVTTMNHMIYQATADGECSPFADLGKLGVPLDLNFTPDGASMLVSLTPTGAGGALDTNSHHGLVVRISPKGELDPKPVVQGLDCPGGLDFAPKGFGGFAGQLFVSDVGEFETPVPMTQPLKPDGKIYHITPGGGRELVASGFINPLHIRFIGNSLWVTDLAGDFIGGKRELPDGFVVEIRSDSKD